MLNIFVFIRYFCGQTLKTKFVVEKLKLVFYSENLEKSNLTFRSPRQLLTHENGFYLIFVRAQFLFN